MSTNLKTILDAMSTGPYLPATLNAAKHSGALDIRKTYPQAPDSLPATPAIVFLPQDGEVIEATGGTYNEEHHVDVWFVFAFKQGDIERAEAQRQLWVGPLIAALFSITGRDTLVSGTGIKSALPETYEFALLPYSGQEHPGIRFPVTITIRDIAVPA